MDDKTVGADINEFNITSLSHILGQPQVVELLGLHLQGHFNIRSTATGPSPPFGPVILCGPPGIGKTMVALVIHKELGNLKLVQTNGVTLNKKQELYAVLIDADENTTIFIDEVQGMNSEAQYILLTAISERALRVPARISPARLYSITLSNFTLILATTHEYLLQDALRERMRIFCRFDYYTVEDLVEIVRQRADALGWNYESDEVLRTIAQRAKGTPRQALNRNLQTCWHVTKSHDRDVITLDDAYEAFCHLQIDDLGLDQMDRSYLKMLMEYGRLPLGVLSSKLSLPTLTIQRVIEPYLLKEDFITKTTASIRVITEKGIKHLENNPIPFQRLEVKG
jgi:Holliday junction DNA helicase RuvB